MTHSLIAIENEDGSVTGVYCHSDGYFEYVGWLLYAHYRDITKVKELISLGALSSLGARIGEKIDMNRYMRDMDYFRKYQCQVVAYHRDRGEEPEYSQYKNKAEFTKMQDFNYLYIFSNGVWQAKNCSSNRKLMKLETILKEVLKGQKEALIKTYVDERTEDEFGNGYTSEEREVFRKAIEELKL